MNPVDIPTVVYHFVYVPIVLKEWKADLRNRNHFIELREFWYDKETTSNIIKKETNLFLEVNSFDWFWIKFRVDKLFFVLSSVKKTFNVVSLDSLPISTHTHVHAYKRRITNFENRE